MKAPVSKLSSVPPASLAPARRRLTRRAVLSHICLATFGSMVVPLAAVWQYLAFYNKRVMGMGPDRIGALSGSTRYFMNEVWVTDGA